MSNLNSAYDLLAGAEYADAPGPQSDNDYREMAATDEALASMNEGINTARGMVGRAESALEANPDDLINQVFASQARRNLASRSSQRSAYGRHVAASQDW